MTGRPDEAVVWHDVECAAYDADLGLWRRLAAAAEGPVLDVGAGTGRVTLDLASRGHDVTALDSDPSLVSALRARAREHDLRVLTLVADARAFQTRRRFALAIAPMQVAQLMGGPGGRRRLLACVRRHLQPGGCAALALADPFEGLPPGEALPPLPDVREAEGWVFSSTPVAVRAEPTGATTIDRVRQAVSPSGELSESWQAISLDAVTAEELGREAEEVGLRVLAPERVPPTEAYVGSVVVMLEAPA